MVCGLKLQTITLYLKLDSFVSHLECEIWSPEGNVTLNRAVLSLYTDALAYLSTRDCETEGDVLGYQQRTYRDFPLCHTHRLIEYIQGSESQIIFISLKCLTLSKIHLKELHFQAQTEQG